MRRKGVLCCAARQAIQWLERRLTARGATLAMVTHDRAFMEATCTGVLELDAGGAHLHGFGGPGSYARFRQARNGLECILYPNPKILPGAPQETRHHTPLVLLRHCTGG